MNKATYLPPEIIKAVKVLTDYLINTPNIDCTDIQVSYLGGVKLLKSNGEPEYISPIALDMILKSTRGKE